MRKTWTILLFLAGFACYGQDSAWDHWDTEVIHELHTARNCSYLDEEEKKVILFTNMARYDGALFSRTFLKQYVEENRIEESSYLGSLRKELAGINGLSPLLPETDLFRVAEGHADKSGRNGQVGHHGIEKRFAPLKGDPYVAWGENCAYGYEQAIDIVITLLIDEGIPDVGHRKNILNPGFNSVGVAMRPHKTYRTNCVMDFGYQKRSSLNEVPDL